MTQEKLNAREALKALVKGVDDCDITWASEDFEKAYQNALAVLREPDTAPAEAVAWRPDVCPITGRSFFMWIEHHATGQMVPTYGGPLDSYTIPMRYKDGSFCCERYDHDEGGWLVNERFDVGVQIVSDQLYTHPAPAPADAKAVAVKNIDFAGWLWVELMDYCREQRTSPSNHNRLFKIVDRARELQVRQINPAPAPSSEADKRDAERYPWPRATDLIGWPISLSAESILAPDHFDAAIDEAIAAQKEADK